MKNRTYASKDLQTRFAISDLAKLFKNKAEPLNTTNALLLSALVIDHLNHIKGKDDFWNIASVISTLGFAGFTFFRNWNFGQALEKWGNKHEDDVYKLNFDTPDFNFKTGSPIANKTAAPKRVANLQSVPLNKLSV